MQKFKKITLPSKLKKIGMGAFWNCKSLSGKMKLPKNLKTVGDGAFAFCSKLTGFRIADGNKHFSQKGGVLFNKKKTKLICYLSGKETEEYKVPSSVTKYLKKITLSENMKAAPYYGFYKSKVKTVILPKSVKEIEDDAFWDCTKLKSLTIKNKKCKINGYPIQRNKNLTIYGYKNSTAQKYAKENGIKFSKIK